MARKGEIVAAIVRPEEGDDVWHLARVVETRRAYPIAVEFTDEEHPRTVHREPPEIPRGTGKVEVLILRTIDQAEARAVFATARERGEAFEAPGGVVLLRMLAERR